MTLIRSRRRLASMLCSVVAVSAASRVARADVCFPTPVALPGLSGAPAWKGAGVLRSELNEPRWAAAPLTAFDDDLTGTGGLYRVMVDASYSSLSVSFQAPTDLGAPSNSDVIYFAFTTDGAGGTLAKGVTMSVNNSGTTDPVDVAIVQQHNYDAALTPRWSTSFAQATWLKDASVWRNNAAGEAAWGINFKVDLGTAGLSPGLPFKILLAMHKQDEVMPGLSVNISTPDPGANALVPTTLFIDNPAQWANASALNAGCGAGISVGGAQVGTRNSVSGSPAPTIIDTTNGAVNHFYAAPTVLAGIPLGPGLFRGSFHLSNWSTVGASDAPWAPLPNGTAVLNGISPASNDSTIEFACPPNTATTTCGLPTPTQPNQTVLVELQASPSHSVPFTSAAAYANMEFKCLGCPASGGTGGTGGGSAGGAGTNNGGSSVGGSGGATNGGSAPSAGAAGALENAAGEAGSDAISSAGGALAVGGAASGGKSATDAGASAVNAGNSGTANGASSPSDKSGCNCALLAAPVDHGYGYVTLLALSAAIARRRRRA